MGGICFQLSKKGYASLEIVMISHLRTIWEPAENLENAQGLGDDFHRTHPEKLWRK